MKLIQATFFGLLLVCVFGCGEEENHYYDYLAPSYIDTVLAADTIQNNDLVRIVHVRPEGCNAFERFESMQHGDTLELTVLYHFHFEGRPCAHGPGLDTTSYRLLFPAGGAHELAYRRGEGNTIIQSVFVR